MLGDTYERSPGTKAARRSKNAWLKQIVLEAQERDAKTTAKEVMTVAVARETLSNWLEQQTLDEAMGARTDLEPIVEETEQEDEEMEDAETRSITEL